MVLQLHPFDPQKASPAEWARFHRFRRRRHAERDPDDPLLDDAAVEKDLRVPDPEWDRLFFAAVHEAEPQEAAGLLEVAMTREGSLDHETNAHMMWADIRVLVPHRRQGIARQLLAKAAEVAKERERTTLMGGTHEADGKAFLRAIGAQVAQRWRQSRLSLDEVDWDLMERWVEEGRRRSPDTELLFFTDLPDDDVLEAYCDLLQEVSNQEPRGDLDLGDSFVTPEILKERVKGFLKGGGTVRRAVTQEANGDLSGLTTMGYYPQERTLIHQWMTGVKDVHRGRGLGKWLKAAMLLRVREAFPEVKVVHTGNATSNEAMLSINVRLGFKPYREGVEVQISREALERYLGA